ncbi:Cytochrome d ubiquinol oxidase subunit 1 [Oligella ureolytica]|uniref:Cytochrome d ubiquinol oxidase subunit 1 n=1 Tax=Oligella ureolytica TaxID=90244 RepID=A0A378XFC0_9BURK|nr:cytochrome ubiquinol oxidase subunit I [Oligella ureolytica]QPT39160.1 cytochrome ubiquinol oxidase subunit I [Oligella ureolytica]SUA55055.1 Cytochrome d ubiquinol oxidase subunit 1 [Oligella ureolytica]
MFDLDVVSLSRLQFAITVMFHFIFVPLTIGLSFMLAVMETIYVITGRDIWRRMTLFWGVLFGINFAIGVGTGIVMEFQFGMNWSYYSHYVGDIFGAPLALEGLMAFFLEASFVGLFFFGWNRMSKRAHLTATWLVAIGTNFSALWILIANGWMQYPVAAVFNPDTMRMEMTNFFSVILNPVAQAKFLHTVIAGYITGAIFIIAVSSWYLLRRRNMDIAKRSIAVASAFGFLVSIGAVTLGDESGYLLGEHQSMKIAALESMWETEPAPASFNVIAIPNQEEMKNDFAIHIPWVMGIIGTRSLDQVMPGINELVERNHGRITQGIDSYEALQRFKSDPHDLESRAYFMENWRDLGYGLLLKKYRDDIENATPEEIHQAALDTVPNVAPLFYAFRIMVVLGIYFILFFALTLWLSIKGRIADSPRTLKLAMWGVATPWIAIECGWFVAEYGRQPWAIDGILPTHYAVSHLSVTSLLISLSIYIILYTIIFIIGTKVMLHAIKKGPEELAPTDGRSLLTGELPTDKVTV